MTDTVRPEDLKEGDEIRVTLKMQVEKLWLRTSDGTLLPARLLDHAISIIRLPSPVDPDLLLAREIAAGRCDNDGMSSWATLIRKARNDEHTYVRVALAAIKATKARGEG